MWHSAGIPLSVVQCLLFRGNADESGRFSNSVRPLSSPLNVGEGRLVTMLQQAA